MEVNVAVIIPVYNAEKTIEHTLLSVFNQSYKSFEILVYNDGSTDNTNLILQKYSDRVKIYSGRNRGVSYSRNYLIKKSKGKYIAFLDADDIWHPQYLESQLKVLENKPEIDLIFSKFVSFKNIEKIHDIFTPFSEQQVKYKKFRSFQFMKICEKQSLIIQGSFTVIRKDVLKKFQYPIFPEDLKRCEDRYFWYLLLLNGVKFYQLDIILGGYRVTENSLSDDRLPTYLDEAKALEKLVSMNFDKRYEMLHVEVKNQLTASYRFVGKLYMGINKKNLARKYFLASLSKKINLKSLILLLISILPNRLHPKWPERKRIFDD